MKTISNKLSLTLALTLQLLENPTLQAGFEGDGDYMIINARYAHTKSSNPYYGLLTLDDETSNHGQYTQILLEELYLSESPTGNQSNKWKTIWHISNKGESYRITNKYYHNYNDRDPLAAALLDGIFPPQKYPGVLTWTETQSNNGRYTQVLTYNCFFSNYTPDDNDPDILWDFSRDGEFYTIKNKNFSGGLSNYGLLASTETKSSRGLYTQVLSMTPNYILDNKRYSSGGDYRYDVLWDFERVTN